MNKQVARAMIKGNDQKIDCQLPRDLKELFILKGKLLSFVHHLRSQFYDSIELTNDNQVFQSEEFV